MEQHEWISLKASPHREACLCFEPGLVWSVHSRTEFRHDQVLPTLRYHWPRVVPSFSGLWARLLPVRFTNRKIETASYQVVFCHYWDTIEVLIKKLGSVYPSDRISHHITTNHPVRSEIFRNWDCWWESIRITNTIHAGIGSRTFFCSGIWPTCSTDLLSMMFAGEVGAEELLFSQQGSTTVTWDDAAGDNCIPCVHSRGYHYKSSSPLRWSWRFSAPRHAGTVPELHLVVRLFLVFSLD